MLCQPGASFYNVPRATPGSGKPGKEFRLEADPYLGIDYRGFLAPDGIRPGETFRMRITLHNGSGVTLSSAGGVYLAYRFLRSSAERDVPWGTGPWTILSEAITPGQTSSLYPLVSAPPEPGPYLLEFDFVHDQVCWFHDRGSETLQIPVSIVAEGQITPPEKPRRPWTKWTVRRGTPAATASPLDYFLIVGLQRSGTSILHANVATHPRIECLTAELMVDPLFTRGVDILTNRPCDTVRELDTGWKHLFRAACSLNATAETRLCGAKVAVDDLFSARRIVSSILRAWPELKVLHVDRRDKVAQFGSLRNALATGVFCSESGSGEGRKTTLDPSEFRNYLAVAGEVNRELATLARTNPFLRCDYEDLLAGRDAFMAKVYRFLGSEPIPFHDVLKKLLPPPRDYILNYEALAAIQAEGEPEAVKAPAETG